MRTFTSRVAVFSCLIACSKQPSAPQSPAAMPSLGAVREAAPPVVVTPIASAKAAEMESGKWQSHVETDEMEDKKTTILTLESENKISDFNKKPTLSVFCSDKDRVAVISLGTPARPEFGESRIEVQTRFDADNARAQRWHASTDHATAYAPNSRDFISRLSSAQTFRFQFTSLG